MLIYRKLIARFFILAVLITCGVVRTHAISCQSNCLVAFEECRDQCNMVVPYGQCVMVCEEIYDQCLSQCNGG